MHIKWNGMAAIIWIGMTALGLLLSSCGNGTLPAPTPTNTLAVTDTPSPTLTTTLTPAPTTMPSPTPQPTATKAKGSASAVRIESAALAGNLIGEKTERGIKVYLPPAYDTSTKRYPVVYFLPGYGDVSMGIFLPRDMDASIQAGGTREMIVVVVPGDNALGGSFYVNSPTIGNWEDFVVQEVVGYVDSHYRTIAQAGSRGISGHSMGGFGALNIAMLHPDVFSAVYSLSPGLFDENGLANSQMFQQEQVISDFLTAQKEILAKPKNLQWPSVVSTLDNFTVAYGLAFAPNIQNPPFYFDYPYRQSNGKLVRNDAIWKQWDGGFGGIPGKVAQYKDNFLKLKGITVDYGTRDEYAWIPQGCIYFDKQLTSAGIPHEMAVHGGNHQSQLGTRILDHMMPFFSKLLVGE
jgi:S-formylglutathione hydrolase FrmB